MKFFKSALFCVLLFSLAAVFALAVCAENEGDFSYTKDPSGTGAVITGYSGSVKMLTVPDTLGGLPVTGIAPLAFRASDVLMTVKLPASLNKVGDGAFAYCKSLVRVTFASEPDDMGIFVFDGCPEVVIACDEGSSLCDYALMYGIGCLSVSGDRFEFSLRGEFLTLERYIGTGGVVTVPETYLYEGKNYKVVYIGNEAFRNARSVTEVSLPSGVENIGRDAFLGCEELQRITVNASNRYYASENGVLYNKEKTTLLLYPAAKADSAFTVPSTVTEIGYQAFRFNRALTAVTLPKNVDTVGYYAFDGCTSLAKVMDASGLRYVGVNAFEETVWLRRQLQDVVTVGPVVYAVRSDKPVFDASVKAFAAYLFDGMAFETITMPSSLEVIHTAAFRNCKNLRSVSLPASVCTVNGNAFAGCDALDDIYFAGDGVGIAATAFGDIRKVMFHCGEETDAFAYARLYGYSVAGIDLRIPDVVLTETRRNSFSVQWKPIEGAVGYHVYLRRPSWTNYMKLTSTPLKTVSDAITGLGSELTYFLCVTSVGANAEETGKSREITVTTLNNVVGDVNQDGLLSLDDVITSFQGVSKSLDLDESRMFVGDVDYDGELTLNDVIQLFQAVSGSVELK